MFNRPIVHGNAPPCVHFMTLSLPLILPLPGLLFDHQQGLDLLTTLTMGY